MGFNLDDYEPVADRLERFWADHPDGAVSTDLLPTGADDGTVTFLAAVYFHRDDDRPAGTGHASETPSGRGVNATSALENCETSAVGRALANAGYSPKAGARPSREEMEAVARAKVSAREAAESALDELEQASPEFFEAKVAPKREQLVGWCETSDHVDRMVSRLVAEQAEWEAAA